MDRETLAAAVEALKAPCDTAAKNLNASIRKALEETLVETGIDKIAKLEHLHDNSAIISIPISGKDYGHEITVYFFPSCFDEKPSVSLNIGTFGSFTAGMQSEIDFYVAAGALAKHLPAIQKKFEAIDFDTYKKASSAYFKAAQELDAFEKNAAALEREKKCAEIEQQLVVGQKVRIGVEWNNEPVISVIERVTPKLVFFKGHYGTTMKKAKVVEAIVNNEWEFVA